jgi:tRNA pseudouridine38-40 synthase
MHIKLTVEYIGTKFSGFQSQGRKRTVQGELEKAVSKYFGVDVKVVGSGRTDAGVHAVGQVISFLLPREEKNLYKLVQGINAFLPDDISARAPELKEKFNARSDAKAKTYVYKCYIGECRSAVRDEFYHQIYRRPDVSMLREAAQYIVGEHDFTSFAAELGDKKPVRTIYGFDVVPAGEDELFFIIRGNGFLKNMVRIIVGTLLGVAEGKFAPGDIKNILATKDRKAAGRTAPAKGLTLRSVEY